MFTVDNANNLSGIEDGYGNFRQTSGVINDISLVGGSVRYYFSHPCLSDITYNPYAYRNFYGIENPVFIRSFGPPGGLLYQNVPLVILQINDTVFELHSTNTVFCHVPQDRVNRALLV